jgi:hypothetical protein
MVFESRKIHQYSVLFERWHAVADGFLGLRRGFMYHPPQILQDGLNILRETGNIFIDIFVLSLVHVLIDSLLSMGQ